MAKVSIISVNYNQAAVTMDMLRSLEKCSLPLDVIIVDNASEHDPGDEILKHYPDVTYLRSEVNLGFAGGNNLGLKYAIGEYMFFINNDTEITEGLIECLASFMDSHPDAGGISPKIYFWDQEKTLQYAGFSEINMFTGRNHAIGFNSPDDGSFDSIALTPYLHGAAMMIRANAIEKAGQMPMSFFLYYEELDWSEMIKRAGFTLYYVPCGVIYHKESASTGRFSPMKAYYLNRNRFLFMRRNFSGLPLVAFTCFFSLVSMPFHLFKHLLKGEVKHAKALIQAYAWNLKNPAYGENLN